MNRDWVLFHLREAHQELTRTIAQLAEDPECEYGHYWPVLQHLYHHLNTAWNARDATPAEVGQARDVDFSRWSRFPTDLPMMEV